MKARMIRFFAMAVFVAAGFFFAAPEKALALQVNTTWTGSNSTDWGDAANWSAGVPNTDPASIITIPAAPANQPTIGATARTTGVLVLETGASISGTASITLNGTTVTVNSVGTTSATISCGLTLTDTTTFTIADNATAAVDLQVSGVISGGAALTKTGTGTLTLSGENTFTGGVTINAGMLLLGSDGALNSTTPNAVAFGPGSTGTLRLNGHAVTISGLTSSGGTPIVDDGSGPPSNTLTVDTTVANTYDGIINDGPQQGGNSVLSLIKSGTGSLTLSGGNGYDGGTTLTAGTLNIDSATAIGGGTFTINGGTINNTSGAPITLTTNNAQNWNGDFTFTGANDLNLGTGAVALSANRQVTVNGATTLTVGGTISPDTFDLTKAGAGTLSFGSNAVSLKGLTISAGTLTSTSGTMTLKGNLSNFGAFSSNGGTVNFNGASAQTIGGSPPAFSELTIANTGAGTTTMNTSGSVSGALTLTSDLTVTSPAILTQSGTSAAGAAGDVIGKVRRTGSGSFGNENVIITTTAGSVTSYDVTLVKGASSLTNSVLRQYALTPTGASGLTATLRLRYLDTELNGNGENSVPTCTLQLWKLTGTTWTAQGSTACDASANWAELSGITTFSEWTLKVSGAPTACKLESFAAARSDDGVVLEWRTGYEVNNVGFNIYRQDSSGNMVRLTPHMVAGSALMVRRGTPLRSGLSYSWTDPDTKTGESPRYWLEDLDASGQTTWNGPIIIDEYRKPTRPPSPGKGRSVLINSLNAQELSLQEQDSQYEPLGQLERTEKKAGKVTNDGLAQQVEIAGKPGVKISVKQEGWYRVSQPQLLAAGLSASVDPRKLQLFVDGQQISMIVRGEQDGKFDAADSIEFYGLGLDTASTNAHVYWLTPGGQGNRIRQTQPRGGASAGDSFPYTVQRKDRLYYFSNIPNGVKENFFGAFIYYQPTDQAVAVTGIAPAANATLEIAMQGFNAGQHQIGVSLNGSPIGTLNFSDQAYSVSTLTFPQALLAEGANTVSLVGQAGNGDFSFVDYMRLTYAHSYRADSNSLKFTADSGRNVTVSGFNNSAVRVVDVTDSKSPQEVTGKIDQGPQGYSITLTTPGGNKTRTMLAFADAQAKQAAKLVANKVSSLRQSSGSTDLVIIGYGDFLSSLQSLKSLRESQGLKTLLVDVEDVYDEFNYGHKSPQALKDFLTYARSSWRKAPKYVLLGGMASFDPKNYLGLGETDLVPTMFVQTTHIETASDDSLADFNGDGIPEMAVGRLPARNSDEAARMVQKIISYDQAPASGAGVLLVADVNKGFNFETNNDQLKTRVPASTPVQDIRRGSDPQAKQHLLEALNQGKKLVNYTGHGSVDIWEASLLTTTDAAALANAQKLSVVVAMTCLNGYYFDERLESLAHALLNAQNGGAVAVWSSSGLTEPDDQAIADQELFRQLFAGASIRLGDAMIKAKTAISDPDVRRTWILIGDPTTRFKQ